MSGNIVKKKLVAPDGGWGWAIAAAFGIYFVSIIYVHRLYRVINHVVVMM